MDCGINRPAEGPSSPVLRRTCGRRLVLLAGHHHRPERKPLPRRRFLPEHPLSHRLPLQTP
ncbi:putative ubiquitin conjugating enzyme E2 D4 (putative) [Phyllostomus discolor]|uniref:Putative ubiquitin conjugating enzyme E2 D4 (Putative) n=1 Tax=Phyllostomus discolor TaxID=89673 RepID=A0A834DKQ5_9CHIR|nr:putative ubiquitin conjugating enzyme E2 D4 (putative) [Phyllostomus discolor]